jgi:hypothetical protein
MSRMDTRFPGVDQSMDTNPIALADAMQGADFVQLNGIVFEAGYLRLPDESTVADDVVMELRHGDTELAFTRADLDDAQHVGDGFYRLKSGAMLRFLATATVH